MISGWRRLCIRNPKPTIPGRFGDWRTHTGSSFTVCLVRTRSSISAWPSNSPHHVSKCRTDSVFAPSFLVLRTELDNADAIGFALDQVLSAPHVVVFCFWSFCLLFLFVGVVSVVFVLLFVFC